MLLTLLATLKDLLAGKVVQAVGNKEAAISCDTRYKNISKMLCW